MKRHGFLQLRFLLLSRLERAFGFLFIDTILINIDFNILTDFWISNQLCIIGLDLSLSWHAIIMFLDSAYIILLRIFICNLLSCEVYLITASIL